MPKLISKLLLLWPILLSGFHPALAENGEVRGRIDCDTATSICRLKGLAIVGVIDDSTLQKLRRLLDAFVEKAPERRLIHTTVRLNSPGGSVSAAIEIGSILRKSRMSARVAHSGECTSACVLIYAGAVVRTSEAQINPGKIGIHQPYFEVPKEQIEPESIKRNYAAMLQTLRGYLREMNVSEQLADEMLKIPPWDVRYLNLVEQQKYGLVNVDPIERETGSLELAQLLGIDRAEYNRREAIAREGCSLSDFAECYSETMNTGKVPPADLSAFGEPVNTESH